MIVVTTQKNTKIKKFPMCTKTIYNKNKFALIQSYNNYNLKYDHKVCNKIIE
jgi:hypothetical protein